MLLLALAACVLGGLSVPLMDRGPHVAQGWDQVVRLRHLYAAGPGLHLLIGEDGQIHGAADPTLHSLLEIRPVGPGRVVIRGVAASRFLCMESDGRLYSTPSYSAADCTFREQILADGYNVYSSDGHGALLSLGSSQQRLQGLDRGVPALARFLPRVNALQQAAPTGPDAPGPPVPETVDPLGSLGRLSQIIHSPSFHER